MWPELKLVSFQRAAIWGIVIQAYLLNAPAIYTELETWRVDLSDQVASAVSTGAIPGCSGSVVEVLPCITGTRFAAMAPVDRFLRAAPAEASPPPRPCWVPHVRFVAFVGVSSTTPLLLAQLEHLCYTGADLAEL